MGSHLPVPPADAAYCVCWLHLDFHNKYQSTQTLTKGCMWLQTLTKGCMWLLRSLSDLYLISHIHKTTRCCYSCH